MPRGGENVRTYMLVFLMGLNFIAELVINLALSSLIVRLVQLGRYSAYNRENC